MRIHGDDKVHISPTLCTLKQVNNNSKEAANKSYIGYSENTTTADSN